MRFLTFSAKDKRSWGVATEKGIIDLGARYGGSPATGDPRTMPSPQWGNTQPASTLIPTRPISSTCPPLPPPRKSPVSGSTMPIATASTGTIPTIPSGQACSCAPIDSFTGHEQPLWRPPESHQLDYEGEIVLVIGKAGHRIPQEEALAHIAGLTLMNEGTLRDWVRHAKFNVTQGKNFVHSGSIGPWLVSADEFPGYDQLTLSTRVNGEQRRARHHRQSHVSLCLPDQLPLHLFYSQARRPDFHRHTAGGGGRFDPPRYLAPGDSVEVEVARHRPAAQWGDR